MDKKYTMNGEPYVVLTVTKPGKFPVAGHFCDGSLMSFMADGTSNYGSALIEVSPYSDFVIDQKVMVRDDDSVRWERRLFSGINKVNGLPQASNYTKWILGSCNSVSWKQCRRPTAEELAE